MSVIRNSFVIVDNASSALNKINRSADTLLKSFDKLGGSFSEYGSSIDKNITTKSDSATKKFKEMKTGLDGVEQGSVSSAAALTRMSLVNFAVLIRALKQIGQLVGGIANTVDELSTSFAVIDSYNFSDIGLDGLANEIYRVSAATRSEFSQTAEIVQDLLSTGLFRGENASINAIQTTEIINKAVRGSGATDIEASANKLTQALSQGYLTASNVTTLLRNTPKLADYIAEGFNELGYTVDATRYSLKQLASDGELTADRVVKALHASANTINEDFEKMPRTFNDIKSQLKSTWQYFLLQLNNTDGPLQRINEQLGRIVDFLSDERGVKVWNALYGVINLVAYALEGAVNAISWFYGLIEQKNPVAIALVAALAGAFAVTLAGGIFKAVSALVKFIAGATAAIGPFGILLAVVVGIIVYTVLMSDSFEDAFANIGAGADKLAQYIHKALVIVIGIVFSLGEAVSKVLILVLSAAESVVSVLVNIVMTAGVLLAGVVEVVLGTVKNLGVSLISGVGEVVLGVVGLILKGIDKVAQGIDWVFGTNLSEATGNWVSTLDGIYDDLQEWKDEAFFDYGDWAEKTGQQIADIWNVPLDKYTQELAAANDDLWDGAWDWLGEMWELAEYQDDTWENAGRNLGKNLDEIWGDIFGDGLFGDNGLDLNLSDYPLEIAEIGVLDQVNNVAEVGKVDITDEDWKLRRDIAFDRYQSGLNNITVIQDVTFGDIDSPETGDHMLEELEEGLVEYVAASLV